MIEFIKSLFGFSEGGIVPQKKNFKEWYMVPLNTANAHKECRKCELLNELYDQVEKTDRNYWIWTELFVMLHGTDKCNND